MTKRVLVTGATGFIGRNSLAPLLARGYEVHAVTSHALALDARSNHTHWHQADLLNSQQVTALLTQIQPTSLLHLAWYAVPGQYWSSSENLRWVQASLHLVDEFVRMGGRRIVTAGTCAEYDWRYGYCTEELTPLKPTSLYGVCKHSLQMIISMLAQRTQIGAAWGRVFWLYGPYEHPQRLVSSLMRSLVRGEPALCTHGTQIRDFAYVEDVAGALVALLDSEVEGPVNIGSGKPITVRELAFSIGEIVGRPELIQLGARQSAADEPPMVVANVQRLTNEVGWTCHYNLKDGLTQTVEWWKEQETNREINH